eukprot:scaffold1638_cov258-Pinguiococcus_pyrenoidosus.AAC.7
MKSLLGLLKQPLIKAPKLLDAQGWHPTGMNGAEYQVEERCWHGEPNGTLIQHRQAEQDAEGAEGLHLILVVSLAILRRP